MESNKKNNRNGGDEHELANDEDDHDQPAAAEEEKQQQPMEKCRKNEHWNKHNDSEDLQLEGLSPEDLINLVRKLLVEKNGTQKQLEESAKQAEDFSQRIVQLDQEKAELHEHLNKKSAEIVEMHKELEEKSQMIVEKTEECNALVIQLNESRLEQTVLPMDQEMKIKLSLETWYDWLAFVPRFYLGKVVPKIGDRKFASIVQKFLHEYGEIALKIFYIVPPYEQSDCHQPRVRVWQNREVRVKMAEAPMPANITNFNVLGLRYFDTSVLEFMRKFQQNGLLDNVSLGMGIDIESQKDIVQPVLTQLLPLINEILSVELAESEQLFDIYDEAGNSKEMLEIMEKTRFLGVNYAYDVNNNNFLPNKIALYCRWLYQTPRTDGKPRVLQFRRMETDSAQISHFLDRIKQDFLTATHPNPFFICINLPKASFQPEEEHIFTLRNDETNEKLVTTMEETQHPDPDNEDEWEEVVLLISRHPLGSTKKWIEENKKEVLDRNFCQHYGMIALCEDLKTV